MSPRFALSLCGLAALFCLLPAPAEAWTPMMNRHVAENAARTMPRSLRAILYTHKDELLAGAMFPGSDEESREHHMRQGAESDLRSRILQQCERIRLLLGQRAPFKEVAREMGVLAHFIGDANNPLHVSDDDPREGEYFHDYARYVENNLEKFPLVFSGYFHPSLQQDDLEGYVDMMLLRSRRNYRRIGQDYIRQGKLVSSDVFDEFSFAFGVGALSSSHSIGDTSRIWLYLWQQGGGDMDGLPYGKAAAASSKPRPAGSR